MGLKYTLFPWKYELPGSSEQKDAHSQQSWNSITTRHLPRHFSHNKGYYWASYKMTNIGKDVEEMETLLGFQKC